MASESDNALAMQLARDDKAVSFLANKVHVEARNQVFGELRGGAVVIGIVLSLLGISTWGGIDGKVEAEVAKAVKERDDALDKSKNEWVMRLAILTNQAEQSGVQLEEVRKTTERLKNEAKKSLEVMDKELQTVRDESRSAQAYLITVRSGPPSEVNGAELVFGNLPRKFFAISGTNGKSFGFGKDTASGGLFTTALDEACGDRESDSDRNGRMSMMEIAHASRKKILATGQEPAFGGDDLELFSLKDLRSDEKPGRKLCAILIGLSHVDPRAYAGWSGRLAGPEKDVERIAARLNDSNKVLASEISLKIVKNEDATQSGIMRHIELLKPQISTADVVLLLFSGHCSKRKDLTSEAPDEERKMLGAFDGSMDVRAVVKSLSELGAGHVIVIVDG